MTREEEIYNAMGDAEWKHIDGTKDIELFDMGFKEGAEWADEHPSEQTLAKTVYLYKRWFYNDSGLNAMEFIKKNWNIEI